LPGGKGNRVPFRAIAMSPAPGGRNPAHPLDGGGKVLPFCVGRCRAFLLHDLAPEVGGGHVLAGIDD